MYDVKTFFEVTNYQSCNVDSLNIFQIKLKAGNSL